MGRPLRSTTHANARIGLAFALALAVAACTGKAASPRPGSTAPPGSGPPATLGPNIPRPQTEPPGSQPAEAPPAFEAPPSGIAGPPAGSPGPSNPSLDAMFTQHGAPELEDLLPHVVLGIPFGRWSVTGAQLMEAAPQPKLEAVLTSLGKSAADLRIATAVDPSETIGAWVTAFQVTGVEGKSLVAPLAALAANDLTAAAATTTIAGKQVTQVVVDPNMPRELVDAEAHYLYATGDVVYFVHGSNEGAAAVLGALP